jgi:hypothetical protein
MIPFWRLVFSNLNLLDLVKRQLVARAVVELGRTWRLMGGDLLRFLDGPAVFQVVGDARSTETVAADAVSQAGGSRPALDHGQSVARR